MKKIYLFNFTVVSFVSFSLFSSQKNLSDQELLDLVIALSLSESEQKAAQPSKTPISEKQKEIALSSYNFGGAFVLPVIKSRSGNEMVLLGRESHKDEQGDLVYNAFGGTKDAGETHPVVTASREFQEETKETIFKSIKESRDYLDKNTQNIIGNAIRGKNSVIYITNFDYDTLKNIKSFYSSKLKGAKYNEMDKVAWVNKNELMNVIKNSAPGKTYEIQANIINPDGSENKGQTIKLKRFFVSLLRPFTQGAPTIAKGRDPRVLFYSV